MANTHCPDCGAAYALVGFRHRCVPASSLAQTGAGQPELPDSAKASSGSSTYQYRNQEARRAYMRDYMRKRRGA